MGKVKQDVSMVNLYYIIRTLGKQAGATAEEILRFFLKNTIGNTCMMWGKIKKRLNFGVLARIFNFYNGKYWISDVTDDEDNGEEEEYYSSCASSESISMEPPLRKSARRTTAPRMSPRPIWMRDYFFCPPPDESERMKRAGQHSLIYSGLREHYGCLAEKKRWKRWVRPSGKWRGKRGTRVGSYPCVSRKRNYRAIIEELTNQVTSRHASVQEIFNRGLKIDFTRSAVENSEEKCTLRDSQMSAEKVNEKRPQIDVLGDSHKHVVSPAERVEEKRPRVDVLRDTQNLVFTPRPHVSTLRDSQKDQVSLSHETISTQTLPIFQPPPSRNNKGADIIRSMGMEDLVTLVDNPLKQRRRQKMVENARRRDTSNDA